MANVLARLVDEAALAGEVRLDEETGVILAGDQTLCIVDVDRDRPDAQVDATARLIVESLRLSLFIVASLAQSDPRCPAGDGAPPVPPLAGGASVDAEALG